MDENRIASGMDHPSKRVTGLPSSVKYWGPVVLWALFTLIMSTGAFNYENTSRVISPIVKYFFPSATPYELLMANWAVRKTAHMFEYFVLSLLLFRAFRRGSSANREREWARSSMLVVVALALGDELFQGLGGLRTGSIADAGIDTLGGLLGQWARSRYARRRAGKSLGG